MLQPIPIPQPTLDAPRLVTELPGPCARRLIEADERVTSPSYTRVYPLAVSRGEGAVIEDVDGNRFLDLTAGIAVTATGHCHPDVVRAIREQSERLLHMSGTDFYYGPQQTLAERLAAVTPGAGAKRVFLTNSGAESVEAALKLARWHTGRQHIIAFYGAFHGRTMGALSLTASKIAQRARFGPLVPGVAHVEYPNPYRGPSTDEVLRQIERNLFARTLPPDDVAAVFVEPIQGEGGYVVPPDDFHPRLHELCRRHGILYVADEVQTGMGRTGKLFASEHWGVEPDITCLAKGIASGMPLGAIIAAADVMDWTPGTHASTFGGNPVCCAAALATLDLLEGGLTEHAAELGTFLAERLRAMQSRHRLIGDVRGRGLMIGVELVSDRDTKSPAKSAVGEVIQRAFRRGLLLLPCGESTIRVCPPLVLTREQAETALAILEDVLTELEQD